MSNCRRTLELKSFTLLGRSSPSVTSPSLQDFGHSSGVGGLGNSPLMDAWADTFEACGSSTSLDALGTITWLDVRHLGILLSSFYGGKINHKNEKKNSLRLSDTDKNIYIIALTQKLKKLTEKKSRRGEKNYKNVVCNTYLENNRLHDRALRRLWWDRVLPPCGAITAAFDQSLYPRHLFVFFFR